MQELTSKIEQWADERQLLTADPVKQMLKLFEEVGEIASGLARGNSDEVKDGIGDTKVVLTILKKQIENVGIDEADGALDDLLWLIMSVGLMAEGVIRGREGSVLDYIEDAEHKLSNLATSAGTNIEECTTLAYDEIKDRKGKMLNGVFVKEADL